MTADPRQHWQEVTEKARANPLLYRMCEDEAREHLAFYATFSDAVDQIITAYDALAALLDPQEMLKAWEKAGKAKHVGWQCIDPGYGPDGGLMKKWEGQPLISRMKPVWRIVPDEEEPT